MLHTIGFICVVLGAVGQGAMMGALWRGALPDVNPAPVALLAFCPLLLSLLTVFLKAPGGMIWLRGVGCAVYVACFAVVEIALLLGWGALPPTAGDAISISRGLMYLGLGQLAPVLDHFFAGTSHGGRPGRA